MSLSKTLLLGANSLARSARYLRLTPVHTTETTTDLPTQSNTSVFEAAQQTCANAWLSVQRHLDGAIHTQQSGVSKNDK